MEPLYRISIALIYFTQFFGIIYYNKKSRVPHVVFDHQEPRYIVIIRAPWVLFIIAVTIILIVLPGILGFSHLALPNYARIAGIILGIITDAAVFRTLTTLGSNISTTLSVSETHALVTSGPYRYVRHPLYGLGIVLFFSLMLIASNWLIGAAGISFQLFVMMLRTPHEEKMLANHFGSDYLNYQRKTGKFFPKLFWI